MPLRYANYKYITTPFANLNFGQLKLYTLVYTNTNPNTNPNVYKT